MLLVLAAAVLAAPVLADTYTTQYDNVDLDQILANDRLLTGYIRCLMSQGPCSADSTELKKNLPDAIENDCSKCTEKQREGSAKVMRYIIDHRPADWVKLEEIYDPKGTYKKAYLEEKEGKGNSNNETILAAKD